MSSGMKEIFDRLRKENVRLNKRIEDLEGQLSGYKRAYAKDDNRIAELEAFIEQQTKRLVKLIKEGDAEKIRRQK